MVLTVSFVLSPVIGLLSPSPANMACPHPVGPTCLRQLDASAGASRPHDFAVRDSIVRQRALRIAHGKPALPSLHTPDAVSVHRIPPNVRDDRDTPLTRDGMAGVIKVIWAKRARKYFCKAGWTDHPLICPS